MSPTLKWKLGWLGYLVFFLMAPVFYDKSWLSTLLALAIFLPTVGVTLLGLWGYERFQLARRQRAAA